MPRIFTIGHSNHPFERFLELLQQHSVEQLVDIRRFPGSRKHPHFNREALQKLLEAAGIRYRWLESLGGRRKAGTTPSLNLGWRNSSFRNFADYMGTGEFRRGIAELLESPGPRRAAVMCAEGLWWQCHRRLVSDYLTVQGIEVDHIMPDGQLRRHVLTPGAVVSGDRVTYPAPSSLFDDE